MDATVNNHWDQAASRYNNGVIHKGKWNVKDQAGWKRIYTECLNGYSGRLLDCGCGPGTVTMNVADLGFNIVALDRSPQMLEKTRLNFKNRRITAEIVQGDAEDLPFEDNSFDVIISQHMTWTVPNPQKVMDEWFRILKPGGKLIYADGDWFNDPKKTFVRLKISHFMTSFERPRRETRKQRNERERMADFAHLWSSKAHRPADDLPMVSRSGFVNVNVRNGLEKEVTHGVSYWRYGFLYNYFLVEAYKPASSD